MTVTTIEKQIPLTGFVGEIIKSLGDAVIGVDQCSELRGFARIEPSRTVEVAQKMFAMDGCRLATITGVDVRDGIDLLYHWCLEKSAAGDPRSWNGPAGVVITLKALASRPGYEIDSIADVVVAANWIEREIHDLLGANFRGHPDMRRLILDDSWPEGVYPLRKSFDQVADRPELPATALSPDVADDNTEGSK